MARRTRWSDAGYVYYVLNRAAGRATPFDKPADYAAFVSAIRCHFFLRYPSLWPVASIYRKSHPRFWHWPARIGTQRHSSAVRKRRFDVPLSDRRRRSAASGTTRKPFPACQGRIPRTTHRPRALC